MKNAFLTLVLIFVTPLLSFADTLLIPDQTVSIEKYFAKCHLNGYLCTTKYFIDREISAGTPQLDAFFDSVDLANKDFVDTAQKKIQSILQTEMISVSQLDMVLRLLEQMNSQNLGKPARLIEEIKFIRLGLSSDFTPSADGLESEMVVYFKTVLPKNKFLKIKPSYLGLPYTVLNFNRAPLRTTTKDRLEVTKNDLIAGLCENAKPTFEIDSTTWKVMSAASCGWTQAVSQNTSTAMAVVKENKSWIVVGALAIGAIVLASKYDVSFQF